MAYFNLNEYIKKFNMKPLYQIELQEQFNNYNRTFTGKLVPNRLLLETAENFQMASNANMAYDGKIEKLKKRIRFLRAVNNDLKNQLNKEKEMDEILIVENAENSFCKENSILLEEIVIKNKILQNELDNEKDKNQDLENKLSFASKLSSTVENLLLNMEGQKNLLEEKITSLQEAMIESTNLLTELNDQKSKHQDFENQLSTASKLCPMVDYLETQICDQDNKIHDLKEVSNRIKVKLLLKSKETEEESKSAEDAMIENVNLRKELNDEKSKNHDLVKRLRVTASELFSIADDHVQIIIDLRKQNHDLGTIIYNMIKNSLASVEDLSQIIEEKINNLEEAVENKIEDE
uniref:Uncharacterized protein n=2 Tax=Clastoptera arizonana TaxID=38151 RepID=A0A1B6DGX6_9HEMI